MGLKRSRSDSLPSSDLPATPSSRAHSVEAKLVHLDRDAASAVSDHPAVMKCSLPPHGPLSFASFEAYDVHYQQAHMNRCSDCQRNFPDAHFLGLHIAENHDPISAARRDRGEKTYACLVPDCDRLCSTPHKRRLHCIDKHQFPREYDFFVVNDGIDRRNSMLRPPHRRRSSTMNSTTSTTSRRRASEANGEAVELVKDEDVRDNDEEEDKETEAKDSPRAPVKLRGRGGFTHPRGSRDSGRGRGRGSGESSTAQTSTQTAMDGLASSMSALQFVPHSLYSRGRGRGRGG
ncbi:uncharacterized protein CC84DRAFT_1166226 [Paraphaeosphaeria sporulosa]|uniref:C2H2-type domain-containing protein n=1 Tax=Paraphaeosphaeria sporulosa TaxID=1460663 RepID=A0A177C9Q3_9PLEO|nr:uncharacterized protein CC84DRAFT_1166226 [Paraphaeosphaeria sporulosa]OAG04116.1 hypothetical protein CC84DRAFT_1166226 [Paraphaeosphaeria sporulosa]